MYNLNKEEIIYKIKNGHLQLNKLSKEDWDDFDIVLEAIKKDGLALQYANNRLKDNFDIVIEAVKQNGDALQYVNDQLQDNEDIALEAIKQNELSLRFVSDRLKDTKKVVKEAIKIHGNLFYASDRLQNDYELLKIIKTINITGWNDFTKKWHEERMEVLANLIDKDLIEDSIIVSNKASKKMKF